MSLDGPIDLGTFVEEVGSSDRPTIQTFERCCSLKIARVPSVDQRIVTGWLKGDSIQSRGHFLSFHVEELSYPHFGHDGCTVTIYWDEEDE